MLTMRTAAVQEVSVGEPNLGPPASITTLYRYDRNGNLVLVRSPVSNLDTGDPQFQANDVQSLIYDERDLLFKSTKGGIDSSFSSQAVSNLLGEPSFNLLSTTPTTSTNTLSYDKNRNLKTKIDAE